MSRSSVTRQVISVSLLFVLVPITAVVVLAASGTLGPPGPGLPDPGPVTRWGIPVARGIHDAAAALTVGFLVTMSLILPHRPSEGHPLGKVASKAILFAAISASLWALSSAAMVTFAYSDVAGSGLSAINGEAMAQFLTGFDLGRSLGLSALLALIVATGCWLAARSLTVGALTVLSILALMPLTVTAHGASNHEAAVNLLGLHLIGVTVWTGGLAAVVILRRSAGDAFPSLVRRYSAMAGVSYVLVLISGVAGASLRLTATSSLEGTYGVILLAKTVAVFLLGAAGWYQRRRILTRMTSRGACGRTFALFAGFEVLVMALTFGLSVALGRTSPFADRAVETAAESLLGGPLPPEPGIIQWLTEWKLDVVWAPIAVLLLLWYLKAAHKAGRQGRSWPVPRTTAWIIGIVLLLWATNGAPAVYARLLPSMFTTAQVLVGLVVPALFAFARPGLLARYTVAARSDGSLGAREWFTCVTRLTLARKLSHPIPAALIYVAFHGVIYLTPLLSPIVSSNAGRIASVGASLIIGYLLSHQVLSELPGSRRANLAALLIVLGFHTIAGITLLLRQEPMGADWYLLVGDLWNIPVTTDQPLAGLVLWGAALPPLMALGLGLVCQKSTGSDTPVRVGVSA